MPDLSHPGWLTLEHQADPALICKGRTHVWGEVLSQSLKIEQLLEDQNVCRGDRVAVRVDREPDLLPLLLGCLQRNVTLVLQSQRFPASELARQAQQTGCRYETVLAGQRAATGLPRIDLSVLPDNIGGVDSLSADQKIPADQPATIIFTSGSSDLPKAVLHTVGNHYYNALGSNLNLPFRSGDRWLGALPFSHVGGIGILFRALIGGGAVVTPDDSLTMAAQIARDKITHLSLVPTQLQRLLNDPITSSLTNTVTAILLGGGPIPQRLLTRAREIGLPVYPTYGLTEMSSQVATGSPESPNPSASARLLKHRQAMIAEDGEILVRGACLFAGYVDRDSVKRPVDSEGWFHTGDLGDLDHNGNLTVTGRKDNMFISGGENIHPETIETALVALDGIEEVVVVPVDDKEFGKRPVAFLKYRAGLSLSDSQSDMTEAARLGYDHLSLEAELEKTLPRFMLPRAYYPWPSVYKPTGLKTDRRFFVSLAATLKSHHKR